MVVELSKNLLSLENEVHHGGEAPGDAKRRATRSVASFFKMIGKTVRRKYAPRRRRRSRALRLVGLRRRPFMRRPRRFRRVFRRKRISRARRYSRKLANYISTQPCVNELIVTRYQMTSQANLQAMYSSMQVGSFADISNIFSSDTSYDEFQIKSIRHVYVLKNMDAKPTTMTCYYWVAREDIPNTYTDVQGWINNLFLRAQGGSGTNSSVPGVTPMMAPKLGHYLRFYKVRSMFLRPGVEKRIRLSQRTPFRAQYSEWNSNGLLTRRFITRGVTCVFNGGVVGDTTPATDVGLGVGKISVVVYKRYCFCKGQDVGPIFYSTNGLDTITTETTINPETDAKQSGDVQA